MAATWLLLASLTGIVRDTTGLALPGATIQLLAPRSAATHATVSDAAGAFDFPDLTVGEYRLVVSFPGFATSEQTVWIAEGGNVSLLVVLTVAALSTLWRDAAFGARVVRLQYLAQTLEQMRHATPLTLKERPAIQDLVIPGCSDGPTGGCAWETFQRVAARAIDPAFTSVTP